VSSNCCYYTVGDHICYRAQCIMLMFYIWLLQNKFFVIEKLTGRILPVKYRSKKTFFIFHHINTYEENDQVCKLNLWRNYEDIKTGECCHAFFFRICTNTKFKIHSATILPVLLYDSAARPFMLRNAYRLRVLENSMLLKEL